MRIHTYKSDGTTVVRPALRIRQIRRSDGDWNVIGTVEKTDGTVVGSVVERD